MKAAYVLTALCVAITAEVISYEGTITAKRTRQSLTSKVYETKISFTKYNRYYEIENYLAQLAENYPDIVSLETIGKSFEGRNLFLIKIGTAGDAKSDKPIILIDGGIHAREWISPAVVTYIIRELVENENNRNLIENTDWYIIPVLNPDGYEYSHTKDRMWRKTRSSGSTYCHESGYKSGVDINRNFDFHWRDIGASSNPCSDIYAGPTAFSEPETCALRDLVITYKARIKLYLSFHSSARYLLYPWAYTNAQPDNVKELRALAEAVEATVGKNGIRYGIGTVPGLFAPASGGSLDWVMGVAGVELCYAFELPGFGYEFELPASNILSVSFDVFEGIKVYQNYIFQKFATRH